MLKLLAIILSLWADRKFTDHIDLRQLSMYNLFARLLIQFRLGTMHDWVLYVLLTVVPTLIVMMTVSILGIFSLLEMLLWVVVLYLCLPSESLVEQVRGYIAASKSGSEQELQLQSESLLGEDPPMAESERDKAVCLSLLGHYMLPLVSLFFWFYLLGIGAALFYKFNWHLSIAPVKQIQENTLLRRQVDAALGLLDWLPARLLGFAYGVAGKLSAVLTTVLRPNPKDMPRVYGNRFIAETAGLAASGLAKESVFDLQVVERVWSLIRKSTWILLALALLITLIRWL